MPLRGVLLCALAAVLAIPVIAADLPEAQNWEGRRITAIRFEPQQQPLTPEQLNKFLPLKTGAPFHATDLRAAIKRLYASGRYTDITADGEPSAGGLAVVFRTRNQWFIGPVDAEGKIKEPPTRGQLIGAANLDLGQPFDQDQLKQAQDGVLRVLRQNGFREARVDTRLKRDAQHQLVGITFNVDPGKRAKLRQPVITGQPVLSPEEVAEATKWHHLFFFWRADTAEAVQSGLQNIRKKYESKDRLMASVKLEGMDFHPDSNTVTPKINVVGGPKVQVQTQGAKLSKKKIKRYVPIYDEEAVDRDLLTEGARNLRDYFQIQGYFDVEVDFQEKRVDADHQNIVYIVNLGRRQKLVHVGIEGNRYFSTDDIRERMMLQSAGFLRFRRGRYSQGIVRRDRDDIKALYQSNGFRDAQVYMQTVDNYKGKPNDMAVLVHISEGPQYVVSDFHVNGITQIDPKPILQQLTSATGQPFSETNVALDRNYIITHYNAAGFPDASFDWRMDPGPGPHQEKVTYYITEGQRRYVRDVLLEDVHHTRMRLIRPELYVKPGDPLSLRAMSETQQDLYQLGIFDAVDTAVQNPDGDTQEKYVVYHIDEGHRYSVAGGVGAEVARIGGSQNSYDNPGGATGFSPRASLDFSRLNMWGLGHTLNFKGRVSSLEQLTSVNYYAPRYRNVEGRNLTFTGLYDTSRDVRTFTSHRLEGSAQISQLLSKATNMLFRYQWRRVTVDQSTLKINPLLVPVLSQAVHVGMLSADWIQDRRDDSTDAHRGIYNTIDVGLASNALGGRLNFGKVLAINATYHTFGKNFTFARRIEFGWLGPFHRPAGVSAADYIPLPERFFAGGSTSLRGFPDNQAGPRDPYTGFPLGGNALLVHNTELRFPLIGDNINGVVFHDMGNVYSTPGDISFRVHQKNLNDFNYMVHAVGFGIRYQTPIGPVRVDLAYSINPPRFYGFSGTPQQLLENTAPRKLTGVNHFQFFISIGQAF